MSKSDSEEGEEQVEEKKFFAELAKTGRAACKKCKQKLENGKLRLAKAGYNPFGPGLMKMWHHVDCLFEVFQKQRATTARINTPDDIDGWSDLDEDDRAEILRHLPDINPDDYKSVKKDKPAETPKKPKAKKAKGDDKEDEKEKKPKKGASSSSSSLSATLAALLAKSVPGHKDNTFREFRRLCVQIANESSYTGKTALVKNLFEKGTGGDCFKGDLRLWIKLLLPGAVKRVYNLQSKQLVKLFSRILRQDQDEMLEDLEQGDVAETITKFYQESKHCRPPKNSHLSVQEVDKFLEELSQLTREEDQAHLFTQILEKCTANDLTYVIRLVKHDLRINAGPKHILEAIHSDAYLAFQTSRDLDTVLEEVFSAKKEAKDSPKSLSISVKLMTPVLPMLAEACKSIEQALKKCPNGMFSEIKYDGERVQVHKRGDEFKYFSRSLKPVMPHKVKEFKDYIPKAFPGGEDLILDSEILMIDTITGQPLPFGTLGIHKKGEYKDACVCLFVFDCIYYNGKSLLHLPIKKRRKYLIENMTEIKNRIVLSEVEEVHSAKDLENMMTKVFQMGLEGLVLKDFESPYEPGKRHWLKVKKDYLFGGAMADTADLVVLGAWFGTGQKGGMMSVFLMGCFDPSRKCWCTVTKVHTGHDDKTLEQLQDELEVEKISKDMSRVPSWLKCTKTMVPDFVAKNPKEMPVWEITGAEFTQHDVHTAAGISIRFPRVTRIRSDKTWESATSLPELKELYKKSKDTSDFSLPANFTADVESESESPKKKDNKKQKNKNDSDDECKQENEKDDIQKRKRARESSPKHQPKRSDPSTQPASRDHSPKGKPKIDLQNEKTCDKSSTEEDATLPEQKSKCTSNSDIDDTTDDTEISESNNQKRSKYSKQHGHKKRYEEEIEDEPEKREVFKKRKGSDSSASNEPTKKVKLEETPEIPQVDEEQGKNNKLMAQMKKEINSPLFHCELFIKSLISEMQAITNPVLYHRLKGQLFDLVHKAQEEQMKLNENKCVCSCVSCHSDIKNNVYHSTDLKGNVSDHSAKSENHSLLANDVIIGSKINSNPAPEEIVDGTSESELLANHKLDKEKQIENSNIPLEINEKDTDFTLGPLDSKNASQVGTPEKNDSSEDCVIKNGDEHSTVGSPMRNEDDYSSVSSPMKIADESSVSSTLKNDDEHELSSTDGFASATLSPSAQDNKTSNELV